MGRPVGEKARPGGSFHEAKGVCGLKKAVEWRAVRHIVHCSPQRMDQEVVEGGML
jgi:hypothetical protein